MMISATKQVWALKLFSTKATHYFFLIVKFVLFSVFTTYGGFKFAEYISFILLYCLPRLSVFWPGTCEVPFLVPCTIHVPQQYRYLLLLRYRSMCLNCLLFKAPCLILFHILGTVSWLPGRCLFSWFKSFAISVNPATPGVCWNLLTSAQGSIYWKIHPPPGGKIAANVIWGENYEKGGM